MNRQEEIKIFEQIPVGFKPQTEVAATYVDVGGKLLLLELAHGKSESGTWGVPAGKLEGDEAPLKGAKRELYEETAIDLLESRFQSLGQLYIRKPTTDYVYHLFAVQLENLPTVHLSSEHTSYQWVSREEAEVLPLMNGAQKALDYYFQRLIK